MKMMPRAVQEDSLSSCRGLMARPPRRDEQKLLAEADKALRFEALLADDVEENENRKFVLQINISDDALGALRRRRRGGPPRGGGTYSHVAIVTIEVYYGFL